MDTKKSCMEARNMNDIAVPDRGNSFFILKIKKSNRLR